MAKKESSSVIATQVARSVADYPTAAVYEAQALYMRYAPIAKIAYITGIDVATLQLLIFNKESGWKNQRDAIHKEINEEIKQNALAQLKRIGADTLDLVEAGIKAFKEDCQRNNTPPSLEQSIMLTQMYGMIHKSKMSEEGSNDGKAAADLSPEQIVQTLLADPYLGAVFQSNVEIRQIEAAPADPQVE